MPALQGMLRIAPAAHGEVELAVGVRLSGIARFGEGGTAGWRATSVRHMQPP
eukprot:gene20902-21291_t